MERYRYGFQSAAPLTYSHFIHYNPLGRHLAMVHKQTSIQTNNRLTEYHLLHVCMKEKDLGPIQSLKSE